jgi:hypothetical protein
MDQPSSNEWVIGLYAYQHHAPPSCLFQQFYVDVVEILSKFGLSFTHIAAEGKGYSGKWVKPSSATGKRLLESGFSGITVVSFSVTPAVSESPAYDRIFAASLNWNSPCEIMMCMVANERITSFLSEKFDLALLKMLSLRQWSYGFAFRDSVARQPDFHVLSLDNGRLSELESRSLSQWYSSGPLERQQKLRSVYPLSVLTAQHLALPVGNRTLLEYLEDSSETSVRKVGTHTIWRVPDDRIEPIRKELAAENALIAYPN